MSNLLAYGSQLVGGAGGGGSTGGGHVIEDASGVDLTQRDTMQFTGYINATDDSTSSKTVISAAPTTVEWSDWAEMTDAEKEGTHWLVVNAPNVGGQVDTNLLTKLWENPDPTASFGPQYITLSSSDYDFLLVIFRPTTSYNFQCAEIASKGAMLNLNYCSSSDSGSYSCQRSFGYASPTYIYAHPAQKSTGTDAAITDNAKCVPVAIYGFKKTITIDTTALIANVSTDARKCMLSDGVTSVEQAIKVEKITGTMAALDNATAVSYPSSYSIDNTIVLRAEVKNGSFWSSMMNDNVGIQVALASEGIYVYTRLSDFASKEYRIYLAKYRT